MEQLIDAADKSENCLNAAAAVFKEKFTNYVYKIEKNIDDTKHKVHSLNGTDLVTVYGLGYGKKLVKHFGGLIQNLIIKIDVGKSNCEALQVNEIIEFLSTVDKECRQSLLQFNLQYDACDANNVFNPIKGPYEHVVHLTLDVYNMTKQAKKRQLDAIFPNVKHLEVKFHQLNDSSFIDCNLPKLEELTLDDGSYEFNKQMFVDLLRNNPQIADLTLWNYKPEALGYIEKYLTNLQSLTINLQQNDEDINFLLNIGSNHKIQKLSIGPGLQNAQLSKLIGTFPKLSQADLYKIDADVSAENIVKFIEHSPSLNRLTIDEIENSTSESRNALVKQLKEALDTLFYVKIDQESKLHIERKVPVSIAAYTRTNAICNAFVMLVVGISTRHFNL